MRGSGRMERLMDTGRTSTSTARATKATGKTITNTATAPKSGLMAQLTPAPTKTALKMDTVSFAGATEAHLKGSLSLMTSTEWENTLGPMGGSTPASGYTTKWTGRESSYGQMDGSTSGSTNRTKRKAMVYSCGQMVGDMKAGGLTVDKME